MSSGGGRARPGSTHSGTLREFGSSAPEKTLDIRQRSKGRVAGRLQRASGLADFDSTAEPKVKLHEMKARLAPYWKESPRAAALRLVKGALRPWIEWGTLVFLEQDLETTPAVPGSTSHEIRELNCGDLPALLSFQRDQADLARRLARGDRAFAFFEPSNGAPLHVRWGTTLPTWIPEVGLWLHPRPNEFYLYDVMTDPLHRGQRLAGLVGAAMDRSFGKQGFRKKVGYVRADNRAMLRSMEWARVPLRQLFEVHYIRWANREPLVLGTPRPPLYRNPN